MSFPSVINTPLPRLNPLSKTLLFLTLSSRPKEFERSVQAVTLPFKCLSKVDHQCSRSPAKPSAQRSGTIHLRHEPRRAHSHRPITLDRCIRDLGFGSPAPGLPDLSRSYLFTLPIRRINRNSLISCYWSTRRSTVTHIRGESSRLHTHHLYLRTNMPALPITEVSCVDATGAYLQKPAPIKTFWDKMRADSKGGMLG
jgi:hypothetical protein